MAVARKKKSEGPITIARVRTAEITVAIEGITPLLVNNWSERSITEMEEKQGGKKRTTLPPRDPEAEYLASRYMIQSPNGRKVKAIHGFPAIGIKKAMVGACRHVADLPMTVARGLFFVIPKDHPELLPLRFAEVKMRRDPVRLASGVMSLAYRAEYFGWSIDVPLKWRENEITADDLISLLESSGMSPGIGAWTPAHQGTHGMFVVAGR